MPDRGGLRSLRKAQSATGGTLPGQGFTDYRELLALSEVDAVIVATPDHWHARVALDAMDQGKDVYIEKPMCHTVKEVTDLIATVRESKRVVQVGSQTTSADQWWKAKKAIADGMIGKMIMSQGSYHRNSIEGEWNYDIDAAAGPDGKGDESHRLEDVPWPGAQAALRCRPLLPFPQVLGLFGRHRDGSVLFTS